MTAPIMKFGRSDKAKLSTIQTERQAFLKSQRSHGLTGSVTAPGDKSISHRSLIFGALAEGVTAIQGLLEGEDVLATAQAMRQLGAKVRREDNDLWHVAGCGARGLQSPEKPIDFGNSGTGARLIIGALAPYALTAELTGDASLSKRPMGRVLDPLRKMGVTTDPSAQNHLPLTLTGQETLSPLSYTLPVPSAQVKSALLLAGLNIAGTTEIIEPEPTRDHTENMIRAFGGDLSVTENKDGHRVITLQGPLHLKASDVCVPGDPSSAAFPIVAALLTPGSDVTVKNVLLNPLRSGLYKTLQEMGADITFQNIREEAGEQVADLRARASTLQAVDVPADRAPSMIDEYPILAIAAATAQGRTMMRGLKELRVKESDRLDAMARGLEACGVTVEEGEDWLAVTGAHALPGGAKIASYMDHRIAMSFLTLGLISDAPITVDGADMIATSFPSYRETMRALGADIEPTQP